MHWPYHCAVPLVQDSFYFAQAAKKSSRPHSALQSLEPEAEADSPPPPRMCSVWLALDEVDKENSCLRYLRGSHHAQHMFSHSGGGPSGFSQQASLPALAAVADEVAVCLRPGDAVLHDGFVLHHAEANRSNRQVRHDLCVQCGWFSTHSTLTSRGWVFGVEAGAWGGVSAQSSR